MKDSFGSIRSNVKIKLKLIKNYSRQLLTKTPLMCVQQIEQLQLGKAMRFQLSQLLAERDNVDKRNPQIIRIKNPLLFLSVSTSSLTHSCEDLKECICWIFYWASPPFFIEVEVLMRSGMEVVCTEDVLGVRLQPGWAVSMWPSTSFFCFSLPWSGLQEADLWTYGHRCSFPSDFQLGLANGRHQPRRVRGERLGHSLPASLPARLWADGGFRLLKAWDPVQPPLLWTQLFLSSCSHPCRPRGGESSLLLLTWTATPSLSAFLTAQP